MTKHFQQDQTTLKHYPESQNMKRMETTKYSMQIKYSVNNIARVLNEGLLIVAIPCRNMHHLCSGAVYIHTHRYFRVMM